MKLLTVAVPCYNSQDYMANCIESLLRGGERVEIIVIDDGSKDDTGRIADEYAAKYPTIVKAIHQENGGHGEGINQGLLNATGLYYKTVDSDDVLSDDFPKVLDTLESLEKDGGVVPIEVKSSNGATVSLNETLTTKGVPYGYKFVEGNVGVLGNKITLPHFMAMFL